jgi:hypothetical protein
MTRTANSRRFRGFLKLDATAVQLAVLRDSQTSRQRKRWPARPPRWDHMPDRYWFWLQSTFNLPNITPNGVDTRAYVEHLWSKLRDDLSAERRTSPIRKTHNELRTLLASKVGDRMPPLCGEVVGLLAGMGMLDRRFGSRDIAKHRAAVAYISTHKCVTELIRDWAAWVAQFGAFKRSHRVLHGGKSSLAEVAAVSELINFTRHILDEPDANWTGISTREKRLSGTKNRHRIEIIYRPIGGWQTRFIRMVLTMAGVRNGIGGFLTLAQVRQRIERCRRKMTEGAAAGHGENALWEFLRK